MEQAKSFEGQHEKLTAKLVSPDAFISVRGLRVGEATIVVSPDAVGEIIAEGPSVSPMDYKVKFTWLDADGKEKSVTTLVNKDQVKEYILPQAENNSDESQLERHA